MKIFNEKEVEKAALESYSYLPDWAGKYEDELTGEFKSGVEYAESKVEDLCIEFATFIENNFITAMSSGKKYINFHEENDLDFMSDSNRYSLEEVYQQFLTQRNGK